MTFLMPDLRAYLMANMFDGNDAGTTTMPIHTLLDEVTELTYHYLLYQVMGGQDAVKEHVLDYYGKDI